MRHRQFTMKSKSELLTEIQIRNQLRRETGLPVIDAEREVNLELAYQEAEDEKRRFLDWRNSKADIEERVRQKPWPKSGTSSEGKIGGQRECYREADGHFPSWWTST